MVVKKIKKNDVLQLVGVEMVVSFSSFILCSFIFV